MNNNLGAVDRRAFLLATAGAVGSVGLARRADAQAVPALIKPVASPTLPPRWLTAPTIDLWGGDVPGASAFKAIPAPAAWPAVFVRNVARPSLREFAPTNGANGRAILIIPGGGYQFVSIDNEGLQVAEALAQRGYQCFVLTYRLPGEGWKGRQDVPLQDAQRAMRVVRSRAGASGFDPDKISVLGFSAGGHLVATLATAFDDPVYQSRDGIDRLSARPFAQGLIYPVIVMAGSYAHAGSALALLGQGPTTDLVASRSPANAVSERTPGTFLAHAMNDSHVPVENSEMMVKALRDHKVPVEVHYFEEGEHAFALGYPGTPSAYWLPMFDAWLTRR